MKIDFKQYYESKIKLLEAVDSSPRVKLQYKMRKYCKIPLHENVSSDDKIYISLKPDDVIEILWEYDTPDTPTVRYVKLMEDEKILFPAWNSPKMFNWVMSSAREI